jgi:hypothetical protein
MEFPTKLRHQNQKCTKPAVLEELVSKVMQSPDAELGAMPNGEILGLLCMAMEDFVPIDPSNGSR